MRWEDFGGLSSPRCMSFENAVQAWEGILAVWVGCLEHDVALCLQAGAVDAVLCPTWRRGAQDARHCGSLRRLATRSLQPGRGPTPVARRDSDAGSA